MILLSGAGCNSGGGGGGGGDAIVPAGPAPNQPPQAIIQLAPATGIVALQNNRATLTLDGGASSDGNNGTQGLTYLWEKVSGPGGDTIDDPTAPSTLVEMTAMGQYTYQLTVDDGQSADNLASKQVNVTVTVFNNAPNARVSTQPADAVVTLSGGQAQATLDGSASDDGDGGAQGLTYVWEQISGGGGWIVENAQAATTRVTFLDAGRYGFRLTVDDGESFNHLNRAQVEVLVLKEASLVATLSWESPTTNADGTPLADLAGYKIYYGTDLNPRSASNNVEAVGLINERMLDIAGPGTYYFWVTALDFSGNESVFSAPVTKDF